MTMILDSVEFLRLTMYDRGIGAAIVGVAIAITVADGVADGVSED